MSLLTLESPRVYTRIKEASFLLLLLVLFSDVTFNWLYVNFLKDAFSVPALYTEGILDSTFILNLVKTAFIVTGVIFWIGTFRMRHLGLKSNNFKAGLLSLFFLWALLQIVQVTYGLLTSSNVGTVTEWDQAGPIPIISGFLLFAIGKAFFDETVYRGFLMPQMHLKCQKYLKLDSRITLGIAIIASQSIYLIIQVPLISEYLTTGINTTLILSSLFVLSIVNSLVYLRTKNLFIAIGIHVLWFHPVFIATATLPHVFILLLLSAGFIYLWPMLPGSQSLLSTWPIEERRYS